MEDIAEESTEEVNYENLRKRLSVPVTVRVPLHNAGRGRRIGGAGDRRLSSMHLLQLAIQSIQMLAKSLKQVRQRLQRLHSGAAAASETQPTPPQPAGKRAGGGRR